MKKLLLAISCVILLLNACTKKETDPVPDPIPDPVPEIPDTIPEPPKPKVWYLVGRDELYVNDNSVVFNRYQYNEDSTISEIRSSALNGSDTVSNYIYNSYENGKLIKIEEKQHTDNAKRLQRTFQYKDDRLLTVNYYMDYNGVYLMSVDSIAYLPSGKPGAIYVRQVDVTRERQIFWLTWTGNNITQVQRYNINGNDTTYHYTDTYTYNDSVNVYKKLSNDYELFTRDDAFYLHSENMIVKSETNFGNNSSRTKYEYVYNELNQLTEMNRTKDALFRGEIILMTHYYKTTLSYIER